MRFTNSQTCYGLISKILHWLIAFLMLFLIGLGWFMVDLSYYDVRSQSTLHWHRSWGLVVIGLAVVALAWRFYSPRPLYSSTLKPWEKRSASVVHRLLFALMFLLPVTGYLISSSAGEAIPFFAGTTVPVLIDVSEVVRDWAIESHYYLAYGGFILIAIHVSAVLKHHFVDGEDTFKKML